MQNVLSIRGGIRGIIPFCCLIQLEAQLDGLTREHINYCAGTSTGALLAAAVAAGVPASQLPTVYTPRSQERFTPTGIAADGKHIIHGFRYDPQNLHNVVVSVFGAAANWTVNDCPIGVMISATAMNGHNWFFVKDNARNKGTTDVTPVPAGTKLSYSKTSTQAWYAGLAVPSLGTGFYPASSTAPKGLLQSIEWTTSTLVDTCDDWVDCAAARQWPGVRETLNPELPSDIDEADLSAIPTLVQIGQKMAAAMDWKQILG